MGVLSSNYSQIVPGALISASYVSDIYDVLMGSEREDVMLSGSLNVTGSIYGTLIGTASIANTASYVLLANSSSYANLSNTASLALTASYITSASYVIFYETSSSYAETAGTASFILNAVSSSYVVTAETASYVLNSVSSSFAETASYISNSIISTTVTITASDLINTAPNNTIKELLPAPGAGKYIAINKLIGKFKNATIAYNNLPRVDIIAGPFPVQSTNDLNLLGTTDTIVVYRFFITGGVNGNLFAKYKSSTVSPTQGDGDLVFEIEYEILDF